ncbi:TIGR04211 family SH3 domain-containing protein [Luminiphilus sp. nBUS_16]|uniref:TIGR04211 family SH3 domain-containing protein n=1 Tax=Luminiphilus sp. nBUS_16 TaxID=3395315 RepID=UPI003EBA58D3
MTPNNTLIQPPSAIVGLLLLLGALLPAPSFGEEQRYITDEILVPVRSGAGGEYRIVNKGLSSGTPITQFGLSEDGVWAEVETRGGTRGWLRAQYIQVDRPSQLLLEDANKAYANLEADRNKLRSLLDDSQSVAYEADGQLLEIKEKLTVSEAELSRIKQISGAAIELDSRNQLLAKNLETKRSEAELLKLENVRLQERIKSNQIIDGALAVLLGVIIMAIAPKLIPKRRRNDGWS